MATVRNECAPFLCIFDAVLIYGGLGAQLFLTLCFIPAALTILGMTVFGSTTH